jgi:phage gpG-like protein
MLWRKENILLLPGFESQSIQPIAQSPYWLCYHGSLERTVTPYYINSEGAAASYAAIHQFNTKATEDTTICDYLTKSSDISPLRSLCLLPAS